MPLRQAGMLSGSAGFSLIEMLVATTVFSFGMGGMAAMMLSAAGGMSESEHHSLAHLGAASMAATLQLSPTALQHMANPPGSAPLCFEQDGCTDADWAVARYLLWQSRLATELPGGRGMACRDSTPNDGTAEAPACDNTGPMVTKVFWEDPRRAHEPDGGKRRAVVQVPQ